MSSATPPNVLSYRRPLPRPRWTARIFHWAMISIAVLVFLAGVVALMNPVFEIARPLGGGTLGTPAAPLIEDQESQIRTIYLPEALLYLGIFLWMQWLFLMPHGAWRLESLGGGTLTKRSTIAAGFVAMLLTIGLLA